MADPKQGEPGYAMTLARKQAHATLARWCEWAKLDYWKRGQTSQTAKELLQVEEGTPRDSQ